MTKQGVCDLYDSNCYVGFLRAMCANPKFYDVICDTPDFRQALKKYNGCLPGHRYCIGFQEMFGGPRDDKSPCLPWDFHCALEDYFGGKRQDESLKQYPLLYNMPKTSLTIEEVEELDELIELLEGDAWYTGLYMSSLTWQEAAAFYAIGKQVMTPAGFSAYFQGMEITGKMQE